MSDVMGMGGMDPETAMAMDMMMGATAPPMGAGGAGSGIDAPCTICGAIVPVDSGAPVEGMGMGTPGMGMDMGAPPAMPPMM